MLCDPFDTPQYAGTVEYGACIACVPPAGTGTGSCDTVPQCGCRSTENCEVVNATTGATACGTAGTANPFHSCNSTTRCQAGHACIGGVCSPFCENASAVCPGINARCVQAQSGMTPVPGYFYCTRTCNPVNPQQEDATYDACGPSVNCFPSTTRNSDCVSGSTPSGTQGANCMGTNGQADNARCAVGHFCRQPTTGVFQCTRFCTYPGGTCGTGFTCAAFATKLYAGPNEIGLCIAGA
jgi:hypothetical protein